MQPQDAGPKPKGYYPFIDGLRAIAVVGVICFHFNLAGLTGGYVGVDVFFVVSGFLITNLIVVRLRRQDFSFAHFYERRARRILPALTVTCVLSAVAALWLFVPHDLREFAKSLKATAFFYSNVVFARSTGYFADPFSTRPLLHTWSLAVEEQFYLVFPLLLYAMHWACAKSSVRLLLAMSALFVLALGLSIAMVKVDAGSAFYLAPARAWELLGGSVLALRPRPLKLSRGVAESSAILGVACIVASFLLYDRDTPFPGYAALLPCGGTLLLLAANLSGITRTGRVLSNRILVYVGLLSYGLYLYHWPILAFSRYFLDHELTAVQTVIALAATLSLAMLSYHVLELPVRSGALLASRRRVFQVSAAALCSVGALGVIAVNGDGFPRRFSGPALQYAAGAQDQWAWDTCMQPLDQLNAQGICKLGAPAERASFLVWGDSHAAALAPALEARANTLGVSGWLAGYSRCPSLIGAVPLQHAADDHPCMQIAEKILELVRDHHIKHVLLVSRWDSYISGWERGGTETMQDLRVGFTTKAGRKTTGLEAFRLSFEETVRRLRELDVDVWVLQQVPPQLLDVPSALAKAVYFRRDPEALKRPYEDIASRRGAAEAVFAEYRNSPDVSFIDPAEKFCPNESPCSIAALGHALYSDGNHLSVFGALWSQAMLDPFFSSIVR